MSQPYIERQESTGIGYTLRRTSIRDLQYRGLKQRLP